MRATLCGHSTCDALLVCSLSLSVRQPSGCGCSLSLSVRHLQDVAADARVLRQQSCGVLVAVLLRTRSVKRGAKTLLASLKTLENHYRGPRERKRHRRVTPHAPKARPSASPTRTRARPSEARRGAIIFDPFYYPTSRNLMFCSLEDLWGLILLPVNLTQN